MTSDARSQIFYHLLLTGYLFLPSSLEPLQKNLRLKTKTPSFESGQSIQGSLVNRLRGANVVADVGIKGVRRGLPLGEPVLNNRGLLFDVVVTPGLTSLVTVGVTPAGKLMPEGVKDEGGWPYAMNTLPNMRQFVNQQFPEVARMLHTRESPGSNM
jgi:hypothetical protein